ncbi:hypothetical protein ASG54_02440 [Aureimonas sp. Leaf460]|nr:hypothetical protein ASG54_02440 [Aureimonas sp. Leaf460]
MSVYSSRVGRDLGRLKLGFTFEDDGKEIETVAQDTWNRHGVEHLFSNELKAMMMLCLVWARIGHGGLTTDP